MELPPTLPETQPAAAPPPPTASLGARLLNVFAIPGEVFAEVKATPPTISNWLAPALMLLAVSWVGVSLIFSQETIKHQMMEIADQAMQKQIDRQHIPKEQAEKTREMGEKFAVIGGTVSALTAAAVAAFATPFWWGLIFWGVGAKVFKANFAYMKGVEVAGLANTIAVLEALVRMLLIVGLGNLYAAPNAALLVKDFDPKNPSHAVLALANVMTIWILAVRSIGLGRLAGVSVLRAAVWVFGLWAVWNSFAIGVAAGIQAAFKM